MRTRTPVCGVCTGFTLPRNPAKFAKKMCGLPSTTAIEVATMGDAVTSTSLVFFRLFKNSACESGSARSKSLSIALMYSFPGSFGNRNTLGVSTSCVASVPVIARVRPFSTNFRSQSFSWSCRMRTSGRTSVSPLKSARFRGVTT